MRTVSNTEPPLFDWLKERTSGVLLHISSLPSDFGIGNFGAGALRFLDFLEAASFQVWQLCPLGPTGFGDSPYQCFSAFAGNPYFIDLEPLLQEGLLSSEELAPLRQLSAAFVDYGRLYAEIPELLTTAYDRFMENQSTSFQDYGTFEKFCAEQAHWLDDYALFMALKEKFDGVSWLDWPSTYREHSTAKKQILDPECKRSIGAHSFQQYLFFAQLKKLRQEAGSRGIQLMGDVPIFVALDSADVWANRDLFHLRKNGKPVSVAGVPPDSFSEDGQLWGNPVYQWKNHQANGFQWWIDRIRSNLEIFDILRLDHFRGFESYWSIPSQAKSARDGKWAPSPGLELFQALHKACPKAKFLAEDLGVITEEVERLCRQTGLPRMAVLQFAFGDDPGNPYLPHNIEANQVVYSGTHDNETTLGWYNSISESCRDHVRRYLGIDGKTIAWDFFRAAIRSNARLAILPFQDLLSLGNEARFNSPGKAAGNWQWRYLPKQLDCLFNTSVPYIREQLRLYGRVTGNGRYT
ncbi:MAG: 4-alpha-glucanotransferase [Coraliomargaritaceae bacterium]